MKLPEIQRIMAEFEKQSEIMDMKEEMMDDAIDSALGDDNDEEEGYINNFISSIRRKQKMYATKFV
jgi:division protein CdvB (Snf7/Vps24/ESCRT-III family)